MQSENAQLRSTSETISIDTATDLRDRDLVIFDENGEQLARTGAKRRFDEFLQTEMQWASETTKLGYRHAKRLSTAQSPPYVVIPPRKQKQSPEDTRKPLLWNYIGEGSGQSSSTAGVYDTNLRKYHDKFEKCCPYSRKLDELEVEENTKYAPDKFMPRADSQTKTTITLLSTERPNIIELMR